MLTDASSAQSLLDAEGQTGVLAIEGANYVTDLDTSATKVGGGGDIVLGVWYENREGIGGKVDFSQQQIFGTTENLTFSVEKSNLSTRMKMSLVDPDFMGRPIMREFRVSAFTMNQNPDHGQRYNYAGADASGSFTFERENGLSYHLGAGVQRFEIKASAALPTAVKHHIAQYGEKTNIVYALGGIDLNRAEHARRPSYGYRLATQLELGRAERVKYGKFSVGGEMFTQLATNTTLRTHGRVGVGMASGGNDLPLFKNFLGGGIGSVRGYAHAGLGPTSAIPNSTNVAHIGGQSAFSAGLEVARELNNDWGITLLGYYDIGGVSASNNSFDDKRSSLGLGLEWDSPAGPVSVFFSRPLDNEATDVIENVQFTYGVRF